MASTALAGGESVSRVRGPRLDGDFHPAGRWIFAALVLGGLAYAGVSVVADTSQVGEQMATGVFLFLGLALLIALGFEFVNGFHDTANAVATVIYTHSMPAAVAVVWSGAWNFLGVMFSSGAVAYSIITLLRSTDPSCRIRRRVRDDLRAAARRGDLEFATWFVGLPNSSSHALIGSILGVGFANQLISSGPGGTGVAWGQAEKVLTGLLVAPLIGFVGALVLLLR